MTTHIFSVKRNDNNTRITTAGWANAYLLLLLFLLMACEDIGELVDKDAEKDTETDTGGDGDIDSNSDTDTDTDGDTDKDTDSDSDTDTSSDSDTDSDTGTAGDMDADTDTDNDTGDGGVEGDTSTDPCASAAESVPNDDRDNATAYVMGTDYAACLQTEDDVDYYEFTVPDDPQGGYVIISITDVGPDADTAVSVWCSADNGELQDQCGFSDGASVFQYFSAAPGASFYLAVTNCNTWKAANPYTINATFYEVSDLYEPNDLRTTAAAIALGETVEAYFFAGWENSSGVSAESYDDWYSLELSVGAVRIALATNAESVDGEIALYDSLGTQIDSTYSPTNGSTVVLDSEITEAGTHYVRVAPWYTSLTTKDKGNEVPQHYTIPYALTVTQD